MSIVTVVSDIHLAHFTNYQYYDGFRDDQFLRLADRIIEEAKKRNSDYLLIAGDLIDKPLLSSYEQHLFSNFIDKLSTHFSTIRYILGQHDLAARNDDIKYIDSIVNIYDKFHKMKYSHDEEFSIDGKSFYMCNWTPCHVIKPRNPVDVFISHITIDANYRFNGFLVKSNDDWVIKDSRPDDGSEHHELFSGFFAQDMTCDWFKLGVFGDIHTPIDWKHIHSCGCPLQKSLSDHPFGSFGFIDTNTLEFERVNVINDEHKFLRIYREGTEVDPDEYTWVIKNRNKVSTITIESSELNGGKELEVSLSNIDEIIKTQVKENGFEDIHKEFEVGMEKRGNISLDFKIKELEVNNFRSIEHIKLSFDNLHGIKYIHGKNGSGKSSLISALKVALLGYNRIKEFKKVNSQGPINVKILLEYNNTNYTIDRSEGSCNFYINGVLSNGSGKRDTEAKIYEELPFLNYLDPFFVSHNSPFYQRFHGSSLLENMFNLDSLVEYSNRSVVAFNSCCKELRCTEDSINVINGSLDVLRSRLVELDKELESSKIDGDVDELVSNANKKKQDLIVIPKRIEDKKSELTKYKSSITTNPYNKLDNYQDVVDRGKLLKSKLDVYSQIEKIKVDILSTEKLIESKAITCESCGFVMHIGAERLTKELDEFNSKLKLLTESVVGYDKDSVNSEINELRSKVSSHNNYLDYESKSLITRDHISKLEVELNSLNELYLNLVGFNDVTDLINECDEVLIKCTKYKSLCDEKSRLVAAIESKNKEHDDLVKRSELEKDKLIKYAKYKELFSKNSEGSIYKAILVKISETLSDGEIRFTSDEGILTFSLKVDNEWMEYWLCSDGQKILMDLLLLQRLTTLLGRIGVMALDEVGANLDTSSYDRFSQIINEYDVTDLFLMMHSDLFSGYDHVIKVTRENNNSLFLIEQ